jgi:phage shock protein E
MMTGSLRMTSLPLMFALISQVSAQDVAHTTEPLDEIKAKVESKKAYLADVRERGEWDQGHLKGAVSLPLSQLKEWEKKGISDAEKAKLAKSLPKGSVVYCHCAAGRRALPGAEALKKLGYDARPLKPGYRDLLEAGFPRDRPK